MKLLSGEVEYSIIPSYEVHKGFVIRQDGKPPGPVRFLSKDEIKAVADKLGGECRLHTPKWYSTRGIPFGGKS